MSNVTPEKILFIVRHAHRDTTHRYLDNGLSEKGHRQAQKVADYLKPLLENKRFRIQSSPKLRCLETLTPISKFLEVAIEVNPLLDEQREDEAGNDLLKRITKFILDWKSTPHPILLISSHGDWIPTFFHELIGENLTLDKAGLAEIHQVGDKIFLFSVN